MGIFVIRISLWLPGQKWIMIKRGLPQRDDGGRDSGGSNRGGGRRSDWTHVLEVESEDLLLT